MDYSREQLVQMVRDYANSYGVDPDIAVAQIQRESGFNPNAVGRDGERGLAQVLPTTWSRFSQGIDFSMAFDPDYNLTTWGNLMSYLLNLYGYNYEKALQAYNGGEGNVNRGTVPQGARTYARAILAQAGRTPAPIGSAIATNSGQPPPPGPPTSLFGLPLIAVLGGGLLLFLLIED